MFHIALYQPEIPPNTGNIIRLSANTGCQLHLIKPLGFELEEKSCRRAGLDYHEWANVRVHDHYRAFCDAVVTENNRIFACTSKGSTHYAKHQYQAGDIFLFGPETRGLPDDVKNGQEIFDRIKIPMVTNARSLNLANSVSIIVYEAWRQNDWQVAGNP